MALDKLLIGTRIRSIREDIFHETRKSFADRCNLTETHIGQIERGEILVSLVTLDKIAYQTGSSIDYLLYGKTDNKKASIITNIENYLSNCSDEELKMYFKCISSIRAYIFNNKKNKN